MLAMLHLFAVLPLILSISAGPVHPRQDGQCPSFALQDYGTFQISDKPPGNALAAANAVFVDPFSGCDLSTVDSDSLNNMNTMREAAEDAETDQFNPTIDAARVGEAEALQNGKIQNKVLKLVAEVQVLQIKSAQGDDEEDKIQEEQTKLNNNVKLDQAAAGEDSKGVA